MHNNTIACAHNYLLIHIGSVAYKYKIAMYGSVRIIMSASQGDRCITNRTRVFLCLLF